jgi:hypothetical protein
MLIDKSEWAVPAACLGHDGGSLCGGGRCMRDMRSHMRDARDARDVRKQRPAIGRLQDAAAGQRKACSLMKRSTSINSSPWYLPRLAAEASRYRLTPDPLSCSQHDSMPPIGCFPDAYSTRRRRPALVMDDLDDRRSTATHRRLRSRWAEVRRRVAQQAQAAQAAAATVHPARPV